MNKTFVRVSFDIETEVAGFPPRYRVYINDELFTERPYYAESHEYYEETLQVEAQPGEYTVRFEPLNGAQFRVGPLRVLYGPGAATEKNKFRILGHK